MTTFLFDTYGIELNNPQTSYFILDTSGTTYEDKDFVQYGYVKERYNLLKAGDLFIYSRPKKHSKNNQFYFFGSGHVAKITYENKQHLETPTKAIIDKAIVFDDYLFQNQLLDFDWNWKARKDNSYGQFFSNYGMNKIPREDFIQLCSLGLKSGFEKKKTNDIEVKLIEKMDDKDYSVDDKFGSTKVRGAAQKIFSNKLKEIYDNKCCITGINTSALLSGSHIVPWSKNKECRLDPRNGLLLSPLMDRLFDKGFITIDEEFRVIFNKILKTDECLYNSIKHFIGKKIKLPKSKDLRPKLKYLLYHKEHIFGKL